jgi:DNA-binding NarL/FixJ family response regulator
LNWPDTGDSRETLGIALHTRAIVDAGPDQLHLLEDSVRTLERSPARLTLAHARADVGTVLLRSGQKAKAVEALKLSLDSAARCGAASLVERVRTELKIAGARPRRLTLTGVESLTAQERRIAEMAGSGRANREIAQALFLSVRTVENTLNRAYRKLGVTAREQLAGALSGVSDRPAAPPSGSPPVRATRVV